ncbi:MAG: ATP-binding protein [Acidimicrobiales bacterium]
MTLVFHDLDEQPIMRRRLDRFLEAAEVPGAGRHGAALIATELFTNAIEHGDADEVRVVVEIDDHITLAVSHPSRNGEPVPLLTVMPPPTSERGRGLAIVNRLAVHVDSDVVGGWQRTEAVLALRGDQSAEAGRAA